MFGIAEEGPGRRRLHDLPQIHHRDPVAQVFDHPQVVRDEEIRQPELLLNVREQVDDLGLDGDVERGDGLVADDQVGFQGESPGDADALPHASRELVRHTPGQLRVETDDAHEFRDAALPLGAGQLRVLEKRLGDGAADVEAGIERRMRVLKDHLHARTQRTQFSRRSGLEIDAVKDDAARRGLGEPEDRAGNRGLAAAALPHQPERLAAMQAEADPVDRLHRSGATLHRAPGARKSVS